MDNITLEEALELFRLPRTVGELEGHPITIGTGRFGPYVQHDGKYISIPKGTDPMDITLEEAVLLINEKKQAEANRHIRTLGEGEEMIQILNGRYGPYIAYKGKNYKIPAGTDPASLDLAACMAIIEKAAEKPAAPRRRKK